MSDLVCRRCGNAMEWLTFPYQRGGRDYCWHCEERARVGLPLLPLRPLVPIEMIRQQAAEEDAAARREHARKAALAPRGVTSSRAAHMRRMTERKEAKRNRNEFIRPYWLLRAEQLGLAV